MHHSDADVARASTAIASWNRDGHLREAATERLDRELPCSVGLLAVRTTDWVVQVAATARRQLERTDTDALASRLGLLERLLPRERSAGLRPGLLPGGVTSSSH